tara:strand:- start:822 stop:1841 length:1020 start_codon:yes stop_codon:yes gene_type:complete
MNSSNILEIRKSIVLKNQWFPIYLSSKLKKKPQKIIFCNKDIVLYRDYYRNAIGLDNTCPHRGASLSNGKVVDDDIICPYHGWAFNKKGMLENVPSNSDGERLPKCKLSMYNIKEHSGFIWLFNGDEPDNFSIPSYNSEEILSSKWMNTYGEMKMDTSYHKIVENGIDCSHVNWVHTNSFGQSMNTKVYDYKIENSLPVSAEATLKLHHKAANIIAKITELPIVDIQMKFVAPTTSFTKFTLKYNVSFVTMVSVCPETIDTCNVFWCFMRNFGDFPIFNSAFEEYTRFEMENTLKEDKNIVENLYDIPDFINVKSDGLQYMYNINLLNNFKKQNFDYII